MCGRIEGAGVANFEVFADILDRWVACGARWSRHGSIRLCRQPLSTVRHMVVRTRQLTRNPVRSREEAWIHLTILCRRGPCALSFVAVC